MFCQFLKEHNDNPKSEFQIPTVINYFLNQKEVNIRILHTDAQWFGVTYQADREYVVERLRQL